MARQVPHIHQRIGDSQTLSTLALHWGVIWTLLSSWKDFCSQGWTVAKQWAPILLWLALLSIWDFRHMATEQWLLGHWSNSCALLKSIWRPKRWHLWGLRWLRMGWVEGQKRLPNWGSECNHLLQPAAVWSKFFWRWKNKKEGCFVDTLDEDWHCPMDWGMVTQELAWRRDPSIAARRQRHNWVHLYQLWHLLPNVLQCLANEERPLAIQNQQLLVRSRLVEDH